MSSDSCCEIVTLPHPCLTQKASIIPLTSEGLSIAKDTMHKLENTLKSRMPAAGLAAPQIGISQSVMIFSWDRSLENLEGAINPTYKPLDEEMIFGWEGCYSVPLLLAHVPRYQNILATYTKLDGQQEHLILRGFGARVFQHETDHLEGLETVHKDNVQVQKFTSHEELVTFFTEVKKKDQTRYFAPEKVKDPSQ